MTDRIDAIELLLEDHLRLDTLAEELENADDPVEVDELLRRIVEELTVHEAIEREIVFPAFSAAVGDDGAVERRLGEHEELDEVLAEMQALSPDTFGFVKRASALLLDVRGHFVREEESIFLRLRDTLDADELARLGERAEAYRDDVAATR